MRRRRVGHQHRNEEGRYLRPRSVLVGFVGVEPERDDSADARPDDAADLLLELRILGQLRILDRFACSDESELREAIHAARFFASDELLGIPVFYFAREARIEEAGVEGGNWSDSRFAGNQASPKILAGVSDRSNRSQPRHDDSSAGRRLHSGGAQNFSKLRRRRGGSPCLSPSSALRRTAPAGYNQGLSATKGVGHYSITEGTL